MTDHSGQFTPGGYLSTVKYTALAGIEPTTFRLLVRRATSCATETTMRQIYVIGVQTQVRYDYDTIEESLTRTQKLSLSVFSLI